MKLQVYKSNFGYMSPANSATIDFGWEIDANKKLTLKPAKVEWSLTPSSYSTSINNAQEFYLNIVCCDENNMYYPYGGNPTFSLNSTFTPTQEASVGWYFDINTTESVSNVSAPLYSLGVYSQITTTDILASGYICTPSEKSKNITDVTLNTGYNSNYCNGVTCKLYKKGTTSTIGSSKLSTDKTTVTYTGLTANTDYIAIFTYSTSNSSYTYDNFVEFKTSDKGRPSPPDAPIIEDKTATSVTLKAITSCEYSKDGTTWQKNNVFTGLKPNTNYIFYQRYKETDTEYASYSSSGTTVATLKSTVSPPAAPVVESKTATSVTLIAKSGYEYSKNKTTWQSSNVFTGLKPNTIYTFYQRVAETNTSYASASSESLTVTTPSLPSTTVYINDNDAIKGGSLYASLNQDGVLKEVVALYCKDVINNKYIKII